MDASLVTKRSFLGVETHSSQLKNLFIITVSLIALGAISLGALSYCGKGLNVIGTDHAIMMMVLGSTAFLGALLSCLKTKVNEEQGFSSKKYFALALIMGITAAALFHISFTASIVLFSLGSWYLWSASIIEANQVIDRKVTHLLHAVAMEVNSAFYSALLFPFTLFKCYHAPKGSLNGRPILMVNGYLSFGSTWDYQRKKLIKAGFGPIYTTNVGSGRSIKTYAEQIKEKVRQIQEETQRKDIVLICHSKGGLVSSYFATHLAQSIESHVTDVVTIGSPLAGTSVAYIGVGFDASEMRPASQFHAELRAKINEHQNIRFFHIASQADEVVPLSSALHGNDPNRKFVLQDIGHLGLVFSSRVANQVCTWLKT